MRQLIQRHCWKLALLGAALLLSGGCVGAALGEVFFVLGPLLL